jgi:hypothetical protein
MLRDPLGERIDFRAWFSADGTLKVDENEVKRLRRESDEVAEIIAKATKEAR